MKRKKNINSRVRNNFNQIWGHLKRNSDKKEDKEYAFNIFCDLYKDGHSIPKLRTAIKLCEEKSWNIIFNKEIHKYLPTTSNKTFYGKQSKTNMKIKKLDLVKIEEEYVKVLKKLSQCDYNKYLKTSHWKHFRYEALKFFNFTCQKCGKVDMSMHIHHLTYKNRGRETFSDVTALCKKCHSREHEK